MPNESRIARAARSARRRVASVVVACGAAALLSAAAPPGIEAPLADAAMRRDSVRVRLLLKQGADVNAAQGDGMTALHWAAMYGAADEAKMLMFAGARLDAVTRNGNYTPLHLAAKAGNVAVIRALLERGANPSAATSSGGALPLHFAAANGSADAIEALVEQGAPVNARESAFGQTALMWAAAYNRVAAIEALVKHGADVKLTSKVEDMAARERADRAANALRNRRVAALKAAELPPRPAGAAANGGTVANAAAGASKDSANKTPTPAGAARAAEKSEKSEKSAKATEVAKGAPNAADAKGAKNAKEANAANASKSGESSASPNPADTVRRNGGNINGAEKAMSYGEMVGGKGGLTALLFAVRQGNTEAVDALLNAGSDINQVSVGDSTSPLLMATINGHFDLAKHLLEKGANAKLASTANATPLYATINVQWAAKSLYPQPTAQLQQQTTYLELMEALLKAGADPNVRLSKHLWFMSYNFDLLGVNTEGATPFWRAAYGTDVPAMKLLLAHGADPKIPTRKPAGKSRNDDDSPDGGGAAKDYSGLPPVPAGGPAVYPIHAASGVGYGEGFAANSHRHAPDGWLPSVKFLIEELGADVNQRDHNGYTALHHAAARGDNQLIEYLMSKGADISVVSRSGQTVADMANGPVQRVPPFVETVALLEKLGSKNSHKCKSC